MTGDSVEELHAAIKRLAGESYEHGWDSEALSLTDGSVEELYEAMTRLAWRSYWNGWNDCASAQRRWFRKLPRDGGPHRPLDPENQ